MQQTEGGTDTDAAAVTQLVSAQVPVSFVDLAGSLSVKNGAVLDGWSLSAPFSQVRIIPEVTPECLVHVEALRCVHF